MHFKKVSYNILTKHIVTIQYSNTNMRKSLIVRIIIIMIG